jgi:ketosteroid isomerase-like protein
MCPFHHIFGAMSKGTAVSACFDEEVVRVLFLEHTHISAAEHKHAQEKAQEAQDFRAYPQCAQTCEGQLDELWHGTDNMMDCVHCVFSKGAYTR